MMPGRPASALGRLERDEEEGPQHGHHTTCGERSTEKKTWSEI